ncbi:hypothetical protein Pyn_33472 [Prunus yedoensis var. nudiflora]|uniref:Uncharacterized protein n=1 Tax=Prunus yedoensis var. nudiflora TaxID=2094558 RepID=A0A314Z3H1_PRUYE|nr:hypothetical protein Pyn_33472 [Prunus yedoensis var. nudiflora]
MQKYTPLEGRSNLVQTAWALMGRKRPRASPPRCEAVNLFSDGDRSPVGSLNRILCMHVLHCLMEVFN